MRESLARIYALVPDAQCGLIDDTIHEWLDERPQPTQAELDAVTPAQIDAVISAEDDKRLDFAILNPITKALFKALNNGDFVPGSNYSMAQIKAIIKTNR